MNRIFILALALGLLLTGCTGQIAPMPPALSPPGAGQSAPAVPDGSPSAAAEYEAGRELFCLIDSAEAAQELAALYGIELVEFSYGVATFHTEEDPHAVIRRGNENGWPKLSLNRTFILTDPVKPGPTVKQP